MSDSLSITIVIASIIFFIVTLYLLTVAAFQIWKRKRIFKGGGLSGFIRLLFGLGLVTGLGYCIFRIPETFFWGASWYWLTVQGPIGIVSAALSLSFVIPVFFIYYMVTNYFQKPNDRSYFTMIVFSIASGIGNSLVVLVINETLNRTIYMNNRWVGFESGLYLYFILGILLFTISAMIVRKRLIKLTADVVYEKRVEIIQKVLKAQYYRFEAVDNEKVYAALNNDTETVSGFVGMFVGMLTGIITLITCFIYLAVLNFYAFISSIVIIVFAIVLFIVVSRSAEKYWEINRDILNIFYKLIGDLINGYKELCINRRKRIEFQNDIENSCDMNRNTRIQGEFKFVGVTIMGEMLYTGIIGIAIFIFPIIFSSIQGNTLRSYVLVFLYMGSIVNSQIYQIPNLVRILICWRRINKLLDEVASLESANSEIEPIEIDYSNLTIQIQGAIYQYKKESGEHFTVGPIQLEFKSGEIFFITGGNGSGKSTLAKIITGLYPPDEGKIIVNGRIADSANLSACFSTIFSDYYLFDKLYGIDHETKQMEIEKHLKVLRLYDKLQIKDGVFSTLKLSSGQRRRLALLISYLEDKPACLFDEWAADQDPEYKKYFYHVLLPELKAKGKIVIAITHDDRYLGVADKVIKMDSGRIIEQKMVNEIGIA